MPGANVQFRVRDYSDEYSNMKVFVGDITAVSLPGFLTQMGALRSALEGIILGNVAQESWVGDVTTVDDTRPVSELAQREDKWLVSYHGDINLEKYTLTIPTRDIVGRLVPGTDLADLTETNMAAFVAAFEAIARTPASSSESVTIDQIRLVGRNT